VSEPESYRVVFAGELLPGHELESVKQRLATTFSMPVEGIEKIFAGKPVVVRANLTREQAQQYHKVFSSAGAVIKVQAVRPQPAAPETPQARAPEPAPDATPHRAPSEPASAAPPRTRGDGDEMSCPKCGFLQPPSDTCLSCGIVFERFLQRQQQLAAQHAEREPTPAPRDPSPPTPPPDTPTQEHPLASPAQAPADDPAPAVVEQELEETAPEPVLDDASYPPLFDIAPMPIVGLLSSLMLSLCLHLVVIGVLLGPRIVWDFVIGHVKLDDAKLGCDDWWLWFRPLLFVPYSLLLVLLVGAPAGWGLWVLGRQQQLLAVALTALLALLLLPLALAPLHAGLLRALTVTTRARDGMPVFAPYASARPAAMLRLLTTRWRDALLGSLAQLACWSVFFSPLGLAILMSQLFSQLQTEHFRYHLAIPWKVALKYSLLNIPTFGVASLFFIRKFFDETLPSGQWTSVPPVEQAGG